MALYYSCQCNSNGYRDRSSFNILNGKENVNGRHIRNVDAVLLLIDNQSNYCFMFLNKRNSVNKDETEDFPFHPYAISSLFDR
jgi:hypothetical protein